VRTLASRIVKVVSAAFAALLFLLTVGRAFAEESLPSATIEYSILTPALQGAYWVTTKSDASLVGLSGYLNAARTKTLRKAVADEHYNAPDNLATQLSGALTAAGFPAVVEEVPRGPDGQGRGLGRGDLPAHPKGRYLVDVNIRYLGLVAKYNFSRWEPFFVLDWRILSPRGDIVGLPHVYVHGLELDKKRDETHHTADCELPIFSTGTDDTSRLWGCFDQAFRDASVNLTPEIRKAQRDN